MQKRPRLLMMRRAFLFSGGTAVLLGCQTTEDLALEAHRERRWQDYFLSNNRASIVIDSEMRRLYYWAANGNNYAEFPIGVARNDELLKRGRTSIVRKRVGPSWTPTPSMRRKYPDLPSHVSAGPDNPMGTHALYLGWKYYAIHGTNDPRSVGYRTTSGCFRLFNSNIAWLYKNTPVGTQVLVL